MKDRNIIDQIGEDVVLLDEDGKENTFEHILTFMYEGKKYVALSPIADEESAMDDDEAEVVLFQITSENGEDTYVSIDNEVLLDEVFAEFLDLMDEINEESDISKENIEHITIPEGVEVYEINGPYFFGAGNKFEEIMASFGDRPKVRIIRMRKVPFVDSTGIHNLTNLCEMSKKEDIQIVLSGVCEKVNAQLEHAGFYNLLGKENITDHISKALKRAEEIIKE